MKLNFLRRRKRRVPTKSGTPQPPFQQRLYNKIVVFISRIFATDESSGSWRRKLFIVAGAIVWAGFAYIITPKNDINFFTYPFIALFGAEILRHLLTLTLSVWLALQLAAKYLDDVYELRDIALAERYILQAALANRYELVEIKEGKVPEKHHNATIIKIGGPGKVKVHLDSAALFESFDGEPFIISSADGVIALDRFDRLRKVISLRDQIDEGEVTARTRDGIEISAKGVRMKFHINRGDQASTLETPYPFKHSAFEALVYNESNFQPIPTKSEPNKNNNEPPKSTAQSRHFEVLPIKSAPVQSQLKGFMTRNNLGEFYATTSKRELDPQQASDVSPGKKNGDFFTRDEITKMIYDKAPEHTQPPWIDIGTWEMPEKAKDIFTKHEDAWKLSLENLKNRGPISLQKARVEGANQARHEILQEVINAYLTHKENKAELAKNMLNFFYIRFRDLMETHPDLDPQQANNLAKTIRHLDGVINRRHWI